jgi:hypothetical protein
MYSWGAGTCKCRHYRSENMNYDQKPTTCSREYELYTEAQAYLSVVLNCSRISLSVYCLLPPPLLLPTPIHSPSSGMSCGTGKSLQCGGSAAAGGGATDNT